MQLHGGADVQSTLQQLQQLPGIGDWTAQYIAMRALGEPDAFPAGDLGVRKALARGGVMPSERDVLARAEAWRPWRAYAVLALWTAPLSAARPRSPAASRRSAARPTRRSPTRKETS